MRKIFVALAFIAIIVSATMLPEVRQRASANLNKLQKSRLGKNIITAIQLELSSKNQENIVVKIIALLNQLFEETSSQEVQAEADLSAKVSFCDETRQSYENQVSSKSADISSAEQTLPVLQSELNSDYNSKQDNQDKQTRQQIELQDAHDINDLAKSSYEKSQRNHNAMLEALKQARVLIVQLQSTSFLQKNNSILAQISSHHTNSLKSLEGHSNKALYSLLMQMSQDVAVQADQGLVNNVVEIIDDLIKSESDGVDAENQAENERVKEYNSKVQELESSLAAASEEISRLESEISRLSGELAQTQNNIDAWNEQLKNLQSVLEEHNGQCSKDITHYHEQIQELNDLKDTIKEVIAIFESQSVQDIKPVVDNLSSD